MNDDRPLRTDDLARASEDIRSRHDESIVNHDAVAGPPPALVPPRDPKKEPIAASTKVRMSAGADGRASLFVERDAADLRQRWADIQGGFVDEPRRAVEQADSLVADVMKRLAEGFSAERQALEKQWDRGDNVTTEDLRVALQRYRSFFDRLLSV